MSMMIIKMPQHQMDEMGECIEKGLNYFGKAMSMYSQMKHSAEGSDMYRRSYPHMRDDWEREDYPRYPEERRGYSRY